MSIIWKNEKGATERSKKCAPVLAIKFEKGVKTALSGFLMGLLLLFWVGKTFVGFVFPLIFRVGWN